MSIVANPKLRATYHMNGQLIFPLQIRQILVFLLIANLLMIPFLSIHSSSEKVPNFQKESHATQADISGLAITWTSKRNLQPTTISQGDRIAGDHIIVKVEWQPAKTSNSTYLSVNASPIPAFLEVETNTNVAEIDTRNLGNNGTCIINATIKLDNGSIVSAVLDDVFLGNFFTPNVVVLVPNGGEVWTNVETIQWQAWDLNADESLTYDILLSSELDETPQLLAEDLTETNLDWDFHGLYNLSTYKIIIRVTDGIYTSIDTSDDFFRAGDVYVTPTSTTTNYTTTTTTMTPYDIRIIGFLVVLMISSVFIALVAYYHAKKI